jgi:hypothetical protein
MSPRPKGKLSLADLRVESFATATGNEAHGLGPGITVLSCGRDTDLTGVNTCGQSCTYNTGLTTSGSTCSIDDGSYTQCCTHC